MQIKPPCPVCEAFDWQALASRTYHATDSAKVSPYARKRLEVLFQVWFAASSEVTLTSMLCRRCGFVCYTPRPEETDINRKYVFLAEDASTQNEISQSLHSDEQRSCDLYSRLKSYLNRESSILDFGGGNGRLMRAFLAAGHPCSLVDFPGDKLPGIDYIGSDLSEIEPGRTFDAITISHVLEHLANPFAVVRELRNYLAVPEGILYVEVPLEIWKEAPLPVEPVTHINYFTVDSLRILLQRAGYRVLKCEEGSYITEQGGIGLAIRAYAQRDESTDSAIHYKHNAAAATLRLVQPSLAQQVLRILKYPQLTYQSAKRALHHRLGKTPLLWRLLSAKPGR